MASLSAKEGVAPRCPGGQQHLVNQVFCLLSATTIACLMLIVNDNHALSFVETVQPRQIWATMPRLQWKSCDFAAARASSA